MTSADQRWGTIGRLVRDSARHGDHEALVDGDVRYTYARLAHDVACAAGGAIAAGIEPGDRVAVWGPNDHRWVVAALGAISAGGVLVPCNSRYRGEEAAHVLRRSRARMLVVSDTFLGNDYLGMLDAHAPFADLREIVILTDSAVARGRLSATAWPEHLDTGGRVAAHDVHERIDAVRPDDPADVFFTSGTTGRPKGAIATHAQNLRVLETWADIVGLTGDDRYCIVNPLFHTFGYKAGVLASVLSGATMVLQKQLDVPDLLACIEKERISVLPGPPTLYQSILDAPTGTRDLSSLRLAVTGAAVVPVRLVERLHEETSVTTVLTAYGLTESTGVVTMCRRDDDARTVATTAGRAIPGIELAVVDPEGSSVPPGTAGEVVVRGYNVMRGYLDDPEATAAAIDPDGWLHTGDIGVLDERGNLRITDRLKDMYICGGFNVYPAEAEQVIARLDAVAEAAVIGTSDERLGEVGTAFVVARPGATIDVAEILAFCRARLANFKVPRHVRIVDALPRNAAGKVHKPDLRAVAADAGAAS